MTRGFDAEHHQRHSIRLSGYDYAQPGAYFVTICTQDRIHLFGEIIDHDMHLNVAGLAAETAWAAIPAHFQRVRLDAFVVMPNHVHGIIFILPTTAVSSDGRDRADHTVGATHASPLPPQRPIGPPRCSVGAIVGSYKSAVTRRINRLNGTPTRAVWQRNYYERIIRDYPALKQIRRISSRTRGIERLPGKAAEAGYATERRTTPGSPKVLRVPCELIHKPDTP